MRTETWLGGCFAVLAGLGIVAACSSTDASAPISACFDGRSDGDETGIDCGGSCAAACNPATGAAPVGGGGTQVPHSGAKDAAPEAVPQVPARSDDSLQNGSETDVDCGGRARRNAPRARSASSTATAASRAATQRGASTTPSCKPHLGGDTCGKGEVGEAGAQHESCCRSLDGPRVRRPGAPRQDGLSRQVRDHRGPHAGIHRADGQRERRQSRREGLDCQAPPADLGPRVGGVSAVRSRGRDDDHRTASARRSAPGGFGLERSAGPRGDPASRDRSGSATWAPTTSSARRSTSTSTATTARRTPGSYGFPDLLLSRRHPEPRRPAPSRGRRHGERSAHRREGSPRRQIDQLRHQRDARGVLRLGRWPAGDGRGPRLRDRHARRRSATSRAAALRSTTTGSFSATSSTTRSRRAAAARRSRS